MLTLRCINWPRWISFQSRPAFDLASNPNRDKRESWKSDSQQSLENWKQVWAHAWKTFFSLNESVWTWGPSLDLISSQTLDQILRSKSRFELGSQIRNQNHKLLGYFCGSGPRFMLFRVFQDWKISQNFALGKNSLMQLIGVNLEILHTWPVWTNETFNEMLADEDYHTFCQCSVVHRWRGGG